MLKKIKFEYAVPLAAALVFGILALVGVTNTLENRIFDAFLGLRPSPPENKSIVLVDVDDAAISSIGTWPISRSITADGLMLLAEMGAKEAVFDIEYTNKSPRGVNSDILEQQIPQALDTEMGSLQDKIKQLFSAVASGQISTRDAASFVDDLVGLAGQTKDQIKDAIGKIALDNDLYLAQAAHFFGGSYMTVHMLTEHDPSVPEQLRKVAVEKHALKNIHDFGYRGATSPDIAPLIQPIIDEVKGIGFTNVEVDADGVRRRVDLVARYGDAWFGQLAFRPMLDVLGNPEVQVYGNAVILKSAHMPDGTVRDVRIPFSRDGHVLLDWPHEKYADSFHHVSFYFLYQHDRLFADLIHNIAIAEPLGFFTKFQGQTPLLDLANQIAQLKEDIMSGAESTDHVKDYRAMRDLFLSELGDFLNTRPEDDIVANIKQALANPALDAVSRKAFEGYLTQAPDFFQKTRSIYDSIEKFRKVGFASLNGAFCIIGQTDTGSTDLGANPFQKAYPNVGTHASLVNMVYNGRFIIDLSPLWSCLLAIIAGVGISFLTRNMRPSQAIGIGIAASIGAIVLVAIVFVFTGWYLPVFPLAASLIISFVGVTFIKFWLTEKEKGFLRNAFSRYLSADVIKQIIANPDMLQLGGQEKVMTALFTDIKGFSTISEKMTATELVALLNQYLTAMSDLVMEMGGTIDKYEGDAIIAFFGAPIDLEDHATRSFRAAIRMKKVEAELNKRFMEEGIAPSPLQTRFGINTGRMVVGNMGTVKKMDYTIIGDAVNLAARLEGVNKQYGTWICVSEDTVQAAGPGFVVRRLDRIRVVGKSVPIRIFELVDEEGQCTEATLKMLEQFELGMELYEKREYEASIKKFMAALKFVPDDAPSIRYIKKAKEYIATPPPANWDGVFSLDMK